MEIYCMLAKTAQIFDKERLLQREIVVRPPNHQMTPLRNDKLKYFSERFLQNTHEELEKFANFFKLQSISILVIRRQK